MANYKVYDEFGNFVGDIIEDTRDSVSDSISGGNVNFAAALGLVLLLVFLWILWMVWKLLWPVIKFFLNLVWWLIKLVLFGLWWLLRLPFTLIIFKEMPDWDFPEW